MLRVANQSLIQDNQAQDQGGAIFASDGASISLTRCDIRSNAAEEGGAVHAEDTAPNQLQIDVQSDVDISNNTASGNGGALNLIGSGVGLECTTQVRFEDNVAGGHGGSICAIDTRQFMTHETIFRNNTAMQGGAICATVQFPVLERGI